MIVFMIGMFLLMIFTTLFHSLMSQWLDTNTVNAHIWLAMRTNGWRFMRRNCTIVIMG